MNQHDKQKFSENFSLLGELYCKKLTPEFVRAYWVTLEQFHIDTVLSVLKYWPDNHDRFPKVSELKAAIKEKTPVKHSDSVRSITEQQHIDELEKQFTLICYQISANNPKLCAAHGKDYSAYKTAFSNQELFKQQQVVRRQLADLGV